MTSATKYQLHTRRRAALAALVTALIVAAIAFSSDGVSSQAVRQPAQDIDGVAREYDRLTLTPRDLLKRARQTGHVTLTTSRGEFDLEVEPFDIRSENYRSVAVGADGITRDLPRTPSRSFRGKVAGTSDTYVRLVLDEGMFEGMIITPAETFFVEPRRNFNDFASESEFVFYAQSNLKEQPGVCGTTLAERVNTGAATIKSGDGQANASSTPEAVFAPKAEAEIATEADFEFTAGRTKEATEVDMRDVVTMVDGIYDAQLGIKLKLVFQRVWLANNDPYTQTDPSALLSQLRTQYNASFSPGSPPVRDLVHLFTGKDLGGPTNDTIGVAHVGTVCDSDFSYGISQSNFTTALLLRTILTAHETGHNFGALHPDEESPAECAGQPNIMNSSLQSSDKFCQFSRDQITNHVVGNGGACLSRNAPGCTYSINPTILTFAVGGATSSANVTAGAGCNWEAAEGLNWLSIVSGSPGSGSAPVGLSANPNNGGPRSGIVDIGGQKLNAVQPRSANCSVNAITPGVTIDSQLTNSDCRVGQVPRINAYIKLYSFNGMAGQQIKIEMSSASVDTFLYLFGPDGRIVAENDDIVLATITNSRIPLSGFFTLPQTGVYTIEATSYANEETGNYSLTLTTVPLLLTAQVTDTIGTGAALNSVTFARSSNANNTAFRIFDPYNFSTDQKTRLILFTSDLGLAQQQNPDPSVLSVRAGGTELVVENVGPFTFPGLNGSYVIVALKPRIAGQTMPTGSLSFQVTYRTLTSNFTTTTIVP